MALDLDDVLKADETTMEVVDEDNPDEPTGCFITGYTIGSSGWRAAQRKVFGAPKPTSIMIERKVQRIDVPPVKPEDELEALARALTNIEGLNVGKKPFTFNTQNAIDLFQRSGFRDVVQQWREHLESGKDSKMRRESKPATGQPPSDG